MNPPEVELCLLLSRAQLSPQARERALGLLHSPLSWEILFERATGFGLFPLLYTGLEALGFQAVPDAVRADWARAFRIHAIRTELTAGELTRILGSLSDAGIPVVPLKGVALAESLYGDPALRVSDDIDVMVPASRAIEAFHVLVASGYQSDFTGRPNLLQLNMRYSRDCLLIRPGPPYIAALELHSGLVWGGPLERGLLEQVWADARPMTFRGAPAFAMSTEWELLYLAISALRHAGASLKWYADIDRLCSRRPVDWKKVSERARSLGWEAPVRASLQLCSSFFETPLDPVFASAPQAALSRVPPPSDVLSPSDNLFLLSLLDTPARKLRYLAIRLFIPTLADCESLSLPESLFFVYYPLRPLRVAAKVTGWYLEAGVRKLFRLFRRRLPR